ncbi:MAG: WD40/YVTN/BNR-like repeat-containing protein [Steroidobacteraceae bacterium]
MNQRLVAVGERGHILLSDDHGRTWRQAQSVPTRALLTGVCFSNILEGVAVGHDEVILTTRDAGQTWALAHFAPESQQPLLDVVCADRRVIAIGAYGVYFSSRDGGATWEQKKFAPLAAKPAAGRQLATDGVGRGPATDAASRDSAADDTGRDFHLNKIAAASPNTLYIAAEAGHLYRTDDGGLTWHVLPSPYDGSFFGVKPLRGNVVLAYGLRGNLFRSEDAGATWRKVETGTHAMLNGAVSLGTNDDAIAVVGLSGVVLVSRDGGKSFALMQQEDRKGLSAAMAVGGDTLVAVGEGGGRRINICGAGP